MAATGVLFRTGPIFFIIIVGTDTVSSDLRACHLRRAFVIGSASLSRSGTRRRLRAIIVVAMPGRAGARRLRIVVVVILP